MIKDQDILYLVDGSSYIHRAYHAIRHLANSKGLPTNASFGFTKMLLKLLGEKRPEYLALVFDAKGPTFRHDLYEGYKAKRPPLPEDLIVQIPYIKAIAEGLHVAVIEKEGYEADDIIGTLAREAEEKGFEVVVVTGDKDFRQIVTPSTSLWDTMKDKATRCETLREEYGVPPSRMVDLMGLSGDTSDNIPGVPGIGEKTAAELIRAYGSIEGVYEHLEEIKKKKLKENLERHHADALLSRRLATIERFVPLAHAVEDLRVGAPDSRRLSELFMELEFRDLWDQFAAPKESAGKDYSLCLTEEELRSLAGMIKEAGLVSLDAKTTSDDPLSAELVGISFCCEESKATYVPLGHAYAGVPKQPDLSRTLEILKEILEDESIAKVGQNVKYDVLLLRRYGVALGGIYFDTMIASYVINPGLRQHDLESLAQHFLSFKMTAHRHLAGRGKSPCPFPEVELERAMACSCEDAEMTYRLMGLLERRLEADVNQELFHNLEMNLVPVLADMEWAGIKVDTGFFEAMSKGFSEQLGEIERQIYAEAGMEFNINSPQQLGYVLFEKLQLPVQKKTMKTRAYSTDVKVLTKLSALPFKIPKLLLRYRTLSKLKSTYLDALVKMVNPSTGRVHTSFNQTVAATGRLSSSNPNLQNIPVKGEEGREIRKGFVAGEGHRLLSADYSQIELRVFAHYSGDEAFLEAFRNEEDIHARTASEILDVDIRAITPETRRIAKAINFGIIYGMGPQKLSEELGIDLKSAKDYISAYYERYRGVARYREGMIAFAREKGYVTTLFNRRRYLPDIRHENRVIRAEAERMAINTPIQGTAADLIKLAMIRIHGRLKRENLGSRMILQVHDELLFEVPLGEVEHLLSLVKGEMEGVYRLDVPLKVDVNVGENWDEAH